MHSQAEEEDVEEAEVLNDEELADTTVDPAFDTDNNNNNQ
jgi:hypothetical protein